MNTELQLNAIEYSRSFDLCYTYYTELRDKTFTSIQEDVDPEELINMLKHDYLQFAQSLREELEGISDWNEQNIIFTQLQLLISDIVFDNEILNTDKTILVNNVVKMASSKREGIILIDLVRCMSDSLLWFRLDDTYRLRNTLIILKKQMPVVECVEPQTKYELAARRAAENEYEESSANVVIPDDNITQTSAPFYVCPECEKRQQYTSSGLDEVLSLGLYNFFEYCRYTDGVPDLYILKYVEKHSDGFKSELVESIWRDFYPWFEVEKEGFYSDRNRIDEAVERYRKNGLKLPTIPDTEYVPPVKKDKMSDEQYEYLIKVSKEMHDHYKGTLDVEKLLDVDAVELWNLFRIERLLKSKMKTSIIEDEKNPIGVRSPGKCPISRDAVGFFFRELRDKGVIKSISDTELSESIEILTGYSKEKIRQNNPMSDKAKKELKGLLLSIAERLQ